MSNTLNIKEINNLILLHTKEVLKIGSNSLGYIDKVEAYERILSYAEQCKQHYQKMIEKAF